MRMSTVFFLFIALCIAAISGLWVYSAGEIVRFDSDRTDIKEIVTALKLTDMSFSHDARYTRHPSQADLFSAFQDSPSSIEHFPSGSVIPPPRFDSLGTSLTVGLK